MIFAVKRVFSSGKVAKKAIVYFEAQNKDEAYRAFGYGKYYGGFRENTRFSADACNPPKKSKVINAAQLIERCVNEYES